MKIRSPDYYNLQALNIISTDHYLADLIASLGTADFVLGSIDRSVTVTYPNINLILPISLGRVGGKPKVIGWLNTKTLTDPNGNEEK